MNNKVVKKVKRPLYIVWVIPIVAIGLALWMIYKYYSGLGQEIVVSVKDAKGFIIKKTPLIYRGIKVGYINGMTVDKDDLSKINISILVYKKNYMHIAKSKSYFVKVAPKISTTEITGLTTILSGSYIEVFTESKSLKEIEADSEKRYFTALEKPLEKQYDFSKYIKLSYKNASISEGAPILYRKEIVGKIIDHSLEDGHVNYVAQIDEEYRNLIKKNSHFYKVKAVDFQASLSGIDIKFDSLATLLSGALSFTTDADDQERENSSTYEIYDSKDDATLDGEVITLIAKKAYKLNASQTHIYYKGFDAGKVVDIVYLPQKDETHFKFKFKPEFKPLIQDGLYFWIVQPQITLDKIEGLDTIFAGNYITFEKDSSSAEKAIYKLHESAPKKDGIHLHLQASSMKGLSEGGVVLYLDKEVGRIDKVQFSKDSKIDVAITIENRYKNLLNDSSIFYLNNVLESKFSLKEISIKLPSVTSIVKGGITFETIKKDAQLNKKSFVLYPDKSTFKEQDYLQSGGKFFTLNSNKLASLHKNTPIFYKEMEVGKVIDYSFDGEKFIFKAYIEKDFVYLINDTTCFYPSGGVDIHVDFPKMSIQTNSLDSIVNGGLSFETRVKVAKVTENKEFTIFDNREDALRDEFIIDIIMEDLEGVRVGSKIRYKSIPVGEVESIELNSEGNLAIKASIQSKFKKYFREDTKIWVEKFSLSLDGMKNASSIVGGSSLALHPGKKKTLRTFYYVEREKPAKTSFQDGLRIVIKASRLAGLTRNSPLYYRQFQIGTVEQIELSSSAEYIKIVVFIDKCYAYIVRENSIFYSAGGLGMELDLSGLRIKTETIETLVKGGIVLITPSSDANKVEDYHNFSMQYEIEKEWLEYQPKLINSNSECS